ncbi:MAG: hypothetical protein NTW19_09660 [Planctomycetota bacterium]|nr:hypothetical protein [Planctomycetota bacterium]
MKRRLFNFAATLSLLIALAAAVGWVTSCFMGGGVGVHFRVPTRGMVFLTLGTSGLRVLTYQPGVDFGPTMRGFGFDGFDDRQVGPDPCFDEFMFPEPGAIILNQALGLIILPHGVGLLLDRVILIPCWLILLLFLPLPLLCARGWRGRRRAIASGCCTSCGYDLRGSPPEGDCPECGAKRAAEALKGESC